MQVMEAGHNAGHGGKPLLAGCLLAEAGPCGGVLAGRGRPCQADIESMPRWATVLWGGWWLAEGPVGALAPAVAEPGLATVTSPLVQLHLQRQQDPDVLTLPACPDPMLLPVRQHQVPEVPPVQAHAKAGHARVYHARGGVQQAVRHPRNQHTAAAQLCLRRGTAATAGVEGICTNAACVCTARACHTHGHATGQGIWRCPLLLQGSSSAYSTLWCW